MIYHIPYATFGSGHSRLTPEPCNPWRRPRGAFWRPHGAAAFAVPSRLTGWPLRRHCGGWGEGR
eukprot:5378218-Pyramimonas_sp.AAC.3